MIRMNVLPEVAIEMCLVTNSPTCHVLCIHLCRPVPLHPRCSPPLYHLISPLAEAEYSVTSQDYPAYEYTIAMCRPLKGSTGACGAGTAVCERSRYVAVVRTPTRHCTVVLTGGESVVVRAASHVLTVAMIMLRFLSLCWLSIVIRHTKVGEQDYGTETTAMSGWTEDGLVQMNLTGAMCIAGGHKARSKIYFHCNESAVESPHVTLRAEDYRSCIVEFDVATVRVCKTAPPPQPMFACEKDECVPVAKGGVSKAKCTDSCHPKLFACKDEKCVEVPSGGLPRAQCDTACRRTPLYACKDQKCVESEKGESKANCDKTCGPFL
eukprot:m.69510 g.69510  ORF g.69510 m.69510 type:complete len:323 (+) comp8588_c0_seq4:393-1361(+)